MTAPKPPPQDKDWLQMEKIRDPGADFGPGLLLIGVALIVVLLVALS